MRHYAAFVLRHRFVHYHMLIIVFLVSSKAIEQATSYTKRAVCLFLSMFALNASTDYLKHTLLPSLVQCIVIVRSGWCCGGTSCYYMKSYAMPMVFHYLLLPKVTHPKN